MPSSFCVVSWPSAPLTKALVLQALQALRTPIEILTSVPYPLPNAKLIQWSSYDAIDHELTHLYRPTVLASSYTFRKALIRKHFLSRTIHSYVTKRPSAPLARAIPKTFEIELSFADELDEMWTDDLWQLGQSLEASESWWILKPGMSDRGVGIRLFNSKEALENIFKEFDDMDSDDADSDCNNAGTSVMTSQLRHFVIQEYIYNPLLLDPLDANIEPSKKRFQPLGHKFHLRAYCVALGALQVYLYDHILALFAGSPYVEPMAEKTDKGEILPVNLSPHLTNTSLQAHPGEEVVRLLDELIGSRSISPSAGQSTKFTTEDVADIVQQMVLILGEVFKAALGNPVHFQPLPNAFELYGIDFLVALSTPVSGRPSYQVKLLEVNAEPAIEMTGSRLTWVLEVLFTSIGKVCVGPFLAGEDRKRRSEEWCLGDTHHHLIKCLDEEVRSL